MDDVTISTGGCLCARVRYEARGAGFHATLCHCASCRRAAGAPLVAWVSFRAEEFRVTRGELTRFRSSPDVERSFCAACGTQLTYRRDTLPDEIDVTVCSLDDPSAFPPADHTWTRMRVAWLQSGDQLPRFAEARTP